MPSRHPATPAPLILASSSPYRRELLERLTLPFTVEAPDVDESPGRDETPKRLAERLACDKARAVAQCRPDALVIGSDQVATLGDAPLGKPGGYEAAFRQLKAASGQTVLFHTGLCLCREDAGFRESTVVTCRVRFRQLSDAQIARYLTREQPYQCAGSFKSEGLGIALLDALEGDDPTALIGLPLIALAQMLERAGCPVL